MATHGVYLSDPHGPTLVYGRFFSTNLRDPVLRTIHAFSFGLFHLIAMRIIFQNFSLGQQGRGQALYSTMWGLGVASGSILAGHYWHSLSGEHIFILAGCAVLLGLGLVRYLPKEVQA